MPQDDAAAMAACTENPHFFRPLLPGFEHRLSIPVAFSGKFFDGGGEPAAVLRGPAGKSCQVEISGRGFGGVGWKKFVGDYDLRVGDFLVFRHDVGMVFDVMIFDPSACERVYPSSPSYPSSSAAAAASLPFETTTLVDDELPEGETEMETDCSPSGTVDGNGDKVLQASSTEKAADGSEPKVPFFVVTIGRNSLKKNRLPIPREFTMKHDLESMGQRTAVVMNKEGIPWPARLIIVNRHKYPNYRPQVVLGRGIGQFVEDNGLKLGDTFCFELVQGGESPVFRMSGLHIDPEVMERELDKVRRWRRKKKIKVKEEAVPSGSSTLMQPYFLTKLTSRFFDRCTLHVPKEFAERSGLTGLTCAIILQNEKGSPCLVNLKTNKAGQTVIVGGLIDLIKANDLRLGDVLRFELVETGMNPVMSFKVVSQEEICKSS